MTLYSNTARAAGYESRPLALARIQPRHVNLLTLASQMSADAQLLQALEIPGTALLGVATDGVPLMMRLASPDVTHVLISGNRASGKTEVIRTLLGSIVLYQKARDIQFVVMEPKPGAFEFLAHTPHLLGDIATTPERALQHLRWLETELERRESEKTGRPQLVVVVDDIGELISHAGREFQVHLARIGQRGRATGMSLVVASSKPNASDLNPALRAHFLVRLIGKTSGSNEGADKLAGRGDFVLNAGGERVRFQAAFLPPEDLNEFLARGRALHSRSSKSSGSGLNGLVHRLRRIK